MDRHMEQRIKQEHLYYKKSGDSSRIQELQNNPMTTFNSNLVQQFLKTRTEYSGSAPGPA
jgi:hypothetical protein